jgi:flagellar protein FlaI
MFLKSIKNNLQKLKEGILEEIVDVKNYLYILFRKKIALEPYSKARFGPLVTFDKLEGYTEIERYWVAEPYVFVVILFNEKSKEQLYYVAAPELSVFEHIVLETVNDKILDLLNIDEEKDKTDSKLLDEKIIELIDRYSIDIEPVSIYKILYYINIEFIGYGRIDVLMKDDLIEDISFNGVNSPIYLYHRKYQNIKTDIWFSKDKINSFIVKLAQSCGKHISLSSPLVNGTLPDGSRLNVAYGTEVTPNGGSFTIRKFRKDAFTPVDLVRSKTYSSEVLAFLWLAIENGKNILVAGSTASGKTSTLNAISMFIPPKSKIISIEDTQELAIHHENWVVSITKESLTKNPNFQEIDMFELLRQAMRQRPEYIIVGEIRGKEALTLFQAMSTGHTTLSTMHADSVHTIISRLEGEPINVPHVMVQALDIVLLQGLILVEGRRVRRMDALIEFEGLDHATQDLQYNKIYEWDPETDTLKKKNESTILDSIKTRHNWDEGIMSQQIEDRIKLIDYMKNESLDELDISSLIQKYYIDPINTMRSINQ